MREVLFLIGRNQRVLWAEPGQSPSSLPDSRQRWEAIWRLRDELVEVAHSHPLGPAAFSSEDETTMTALQAALGRPLRFSVVTPDEVIVRDEGRTVRATPEPAWANELRRASGL